jgi:hypothetical protein
VVLDDVAGRAELLVQRAATLHVELLGHRDLQALDVVAVPDRLQERIREPEVDEVLHRLLAEVVVDPEDGAVVERLGQRLLQAVRGREVAAERLLDDHPRAVRAADLRQRRDDRREQARRDREVVQRALRAAERLPQPLEGRRIGVVPRDHAQARAQLRVRRGIELTGRLEALPHALAQRVEIAVARDADHRHVEPPALHEVLQRREDLLVR